MSEDAAEEGTRPPDRTLGLVGATSVGVGAIVGGGILVLAGVAYQTTGPSAIIAFGLNGIVAVLTALSFAEISTAFPESGGAYTFAKKVLSVRSAFAVGWILWFAYIVAGVLYALGFAAYAVLTIEGVFTALGGSAPEWLAGRNALLLLAVLATAGYALSLIRSGSGGGQLATIGKVVVFAIVIAVGIAAFVGQPIVETQDALTPFLSDGASGLIVAMGFTFIALQGFDLIPAIAGEIKNPQRNIPLAMFASLGIALAIYLPLLFLVATVGVEPGENISELAAAHPETIIAVAVERFMGAAGYWLIVVAALLSTLSALNANLMAASRVAVTMARDRTLPSVLRHVHAQRQTPIMAIYATALTLVAILFMIPDLASAGAAASLIFLICFTLTHLTTFLARTRGGAREGAFLTPWFPLIPILGGAACLSLATFQALMVPAAGRIMLIWLGLGVILYYAIFKVTAEAADASAEALDPSLTTLRGKNPLVLVPVANPIHAAALVSVANALAPSESSRVLLLTIVRAEIDDREAARAGLADAQRVVGEALDSSFAAGHSPSALITIAPKPWDEIRRIAEHYDCESLLLGLDAGGSSPELDDRLENLINEIDCDIGVMSAPPGWLLEEVENILVPVGGRGVEHGLRARLLSSICRAAPRNITFMSVLPNTTTDEEVAESTRSIRRLAEVKVPGKPTVDVKRGEDPVAILIAESAKFELVVLGLQEAGWGRKVFGGISLQIARESRCAAIMLSAGRSRAFRELYRPIRDVVNAIPWNPKRSS